MARAPDPDPPLDETKAQFGTAPTRAAPDVETRALTPNPDADASLAGAGVPPTLDLVRDQETELYRASGAPGGVLSEETRSITEPIKPKGVQPGSSQRRELMGSWGTVSADGKLEPGQVVFGRYLVKQPLGRGGMGAVWRVRHVTLDTDRALKMIVANIAFNAEARARFAREARVMARFNHPNAVTVHDAVLDNDVAFIEMELVQGQSLDRILERGKPMPLDWTARILRQLCDVLQVAHDNGIVHRDLKPSNLMLLDGRPAGEEFLKVLDFGIAKILGADEGGDIHTLTNAFIGTPPYTSPEQANGTADARSDIYSVGVILYEFLTGRRPFSGPVVKQIHDTVYTPPPPFRQVNPEVSVPAEVEKLVLRCLAKNPQDRPPSARALREEFDRLVPPPAASGTVVVAPPPPRSLWAWAAATVGLIGLAVGIAAYLTRPHSNPLPEPSPTIQEVAVPSGLERLYEPDPTAGRDPRGRPLALVLRGDPTAVFRLILGTDEFEMGGFGRDDQPVPPVRKVPLRDFYMQETEVTNGQFERFLSEVPDFTPPLWQQARNDLVRYLISKGESESEALAHARTHPAVGIDHATAQRYARWAGGRLPTSAEWEYAARAGGEPKRLFIWGNARPPEPGSADAYIDRDTEAGARTAAVRAYNTDRTPHGIYDLTGNVREWTDDLSPATNLEPNGPPQYVVRGGAGWQYNAGQFATTAFEVLPDAPSLNLGFRVVLDVPLEQP